MSAVPFVVPKFLECLDIFSDGITVLSASNLTTRTWSGSLCCFKSIPDGIPNIAQCAGLITIDSPASCLKILPNSKRFLCGCDNGAIMLWELKEEDRGFALSCLAEPLEHDNFVSSLSLNSSYQTAVSSSEDRRIKIWDVEELSSIRTLSGHSSGILGVDCHPSEADVFASCARDSELILWDQRLSIPGKIVEETSQEPPTSVHWLRNKDNVLAVGRENGSLTLYDVRNVQLPTCTLSVHERTVARLSSSADGNFLATSGEDCRIKILDLSAAVPVQFYESSEHKDFAYGLCWFLASQQNQLISCGWDTKILKHNITLD